MRSVKKIRKTIAVIGYGSQGRAIALNMRDSGYDVIVGLRPRSKSRRLASKDGISKITTVSQAVKNCDVIVFAFPDHPDDRDQIILESLWAGVPHIVVIHAEADEGQVRILGRAHILIKPVYALP